MSLEKTLEDMKGIYNNLIEFIECEEDIEEKYQNLIILLEYQRIQENKFYLRTFLHVIAKTANNHQCVSSFFDKIEKILQFFKESIITYFSNKEIFNFFKGNKRILLFLFEEKMLIFDSYVAQTMVLEKYIDMKYPQYFYPEIKPYVNKYWFPSYKIDISYFSSSSIQNNKKRYVLVKGEPIKLPDDFYEKRKKGVNENYICQLIQKDSIKDFIVYINKNNISVNEPIKPSIYETNPFLLKEKKPFYFNFNLDNDDNGEKILLIDYAAFYGSIQIFQYLKLNNAELSPSLFLYAIHGQNTEIIHLLEESNMFDENHSIFNLFGESIYMKCFRESIKCHHNDIANYFKDNYLLDEKEFAFEACIYYIKYRNLTYFNVDLFDQESFFILCKYDYPSFVEILLKTTKIDVNNYIIPKKLLFHSTFLNFNRIKNNKLF